MISVYFGRPLCEVRGKLEPLLQVANYVAKFANQIANFDIKFPTLARLNFPSLVVEKKQDMLLESHGDIQTRFLNWSRKVEVA